MIKQNLKFYFKDLHGKLNLTVVVISETYQTRLSLLYEFHMKRPLM